jgi:hypothetical protein
LDKNKESNPDIKKTFEQWLDFVLLCKQIFALPEKKPGAKVQLLIQIGER